MLAPLPFPFLDRGHQIVGLVMAWSVAAFALPVQAEPTPVPVTPPGPVGVWYDHTGRGAVEITPCDNRLCGRIVWLKDTKNGKACGVQVLGNVPPAGPGVWDGGWIYDIDENNKYDVEIRTIGADRLKILGYAGLKLLGETMYWTRAPADLPRCKA